MDSLDMDSHAVHNIIPSAVLTALAIALVTARFCARARIHGKLELSDWVVAAALFFSVGFMAMLIAEMKFGMGWHETDLLPETLTRQLIIFWLSIPVYNVAIILAKVSIFLQYSRVFQTKRMRIVSRIIISMLAVFGLWAVLSALIRCIPIDKAWQPNFQGHCVKNEILWLINAGVYLITDLAVIIIPIPESFALYLSQRQKIALSVIFALGGLVLIISSIRLQSVVVLSTSSDFSHDSPNFTMWSSIECNTAIICACLPTLRPLLSRIWPSIMPDLDTSRSQTTRPSSRTFAYRSRQTTPADGIELARLREDGRANSGNYHNVDDECWNRRRLPIPGNAFAEDLYRKGSFFQLPRDDSLP